MALQFRFTLIHSSGSQEISEPGGWKEIKVILDRDAEYHCLIEFFEVSFTYYGNNGQHDGGMDFIQDIIDTYGINESITNRIEVSDNGGKTYDRLWEPISCESLNNLVP